MKKKRLYVYAPNDRFNYGDLLFPHVITFYFKKYFDDIVYVSTSNSDLSEKGGLPTVRYDALYNVDLTWENHLIVAGGECLCVRWNTILSFVKPWVSVANRITNKLKKIFGSWIIEILEIIVNKLCNTKTYFAFSVGKNELPHFESIIYNSLGGCNLLASGLLKDEKVRGILSSVDILTVRDEETSNALNKYDIKNVICPDSAIIMSDIFSEDILQSHLSININDFSEKFIFFQGNNNTWKNKYDSAVRQLEDIQNITGAIICLCPIGTALCHEDDIALSRIYKNLRNRNKFIFVSNPNIFDIMWLIKHSEMYIGTSLHGIITAMSFGIPFIGYGSKKQKVFIQKWAKGTANISTPENLVSSVKHNQSYLDYNNVKDIVYKMFSNYLSFYTKQ